MSLCLDHPNNIATHTNIKSYIYPEDADQSEEVRVIGSSYAVVKPVTVMIKVITASVTLSTVFSIVVYLGFTYSASEFKTQIDIVLSLG